jgi:hypothetical protein
MANILISSADGSTRPLAQTPWAGLADAIHSVALEGEDALASWFFPLHRPPIDDVAIRCDGEIHLNSFL